MDVIHDRVAGLDVHLKTVVACVRAPNKRGGRTGTTRTFLTFAGDLQALREWLLQQGVTHVAMEATGIYWRPVWYALEDAGFTEIVLTSSRNMRIVPGRKTDVSDAAWIAQLLEVGLLRGSYIPPQPLRELRDLTRYRKRLVQDRTREGQRVEKVLEDAGIKLGAVASETLSVSGRAMIEALIAGERDPVVLADLARKRMRARIPELRQALIGRFNDHHALMLRLHLDHIDHIEALLARVDVQVESAMVPYAADVQRLLTIPGVGVTTAQVLIAEIGSDMSVFPTAGHLASWCGVCPGNNQSAGRQRSGATNHGNPWLSDALIQAAWAATRTRNTWLATKYWRLARRIGKKKALIAVAHSIVVALWHCHTRRCDYVDLGTDWWHRLEDPRRETERLTRRLEALGHHVTLDPVA